MTPALLIAASLLSASPAAQGQDDVVFRALDDEVQRARGLKMEGLDAPYYLMAYANDTESFHAQAAFGSLLSRGDEKHRTLAVHVRVGTPELDNTNFADRGDFSFMFEMGGGGIASPVEPDYDALRQSLWLRFDDAYKAAVEAIARKRAFLETNDVVDRPADFAPAPVTDLVLPREKLQVDKSRWTRLVKRASAVFRSHGQIYGGEVSVHASVNHQYFVDSDRHRDRFGEPLIDFSIRAHTQAQDGMELRAEYDLHGRTEADLPKDDELVKAAGEVATRLEALAKAPVLSEDYTGPVLFTGRAAARFFLDTVGDPLSNPREVLGESQQGRLIDRLGKHIGSKLLTVRDDPTQKSWRGQPLLGYFPVDDDGVKPQPITLVERGVLKTYYMSRVPTQRIQQTNGHSRAGQGSVGNLFVESVQPQSREALKKQLIDLAKEDDLDYGLLVEELDGQGESRFFGGGAGNVSLPAPLLVYKVYADGREELVRGASFKPASYRVLKDIVGLGGDPTLVNTLQRGQRVSVVAPSVLVKELELKKPKDEFEKPPASPRPSFADR